MGNTFGENLKNVRTRLNLTQEDLAHLMGYKGKSAISRIENGSNDVNLDTVKKFCSVLRCNPLELVGYKDNIDNAKPEHPFKVAEPELTYHTGKYEEYLPYLEKAEEWQQA